MITIIFIILIGTFLQVIAGILSLITTPLPDNFITSSLQLAQEIHKIKIIFPWTDDLINITIFWANITIAFWFIRLGQKLIGFLPFFNKPKIIE